MISENKMLLFCFFSVPLLCWPNYGMRYLRPNRFTMMLVCGKQMSRRFWSLMEVQNFWPQMQAHGHIPESSVHYPFNEVLTICRFMIKWLQMILNGLKWLQLIFRHVETHLESFQIIWSNLSHEVTKLAKLKLNYWK